MLDIAKPSLKQVAGVLDTKHSGQDASFSGISIDSRTITAGNLFIALKGPNFDGHDYIVNAAQQGASAALVSQKVTEIIPHLKVKDTQVALADMASAWRNAADIKVTGITGSNGKTTVKEMVASIFSLGEPGLKTHGNLNNEIGVPLTLLRIKPEHKWAVVEMGASGPGEINSLAKITRPTVALINNVAAAHIAGFGSVKQIAITKGEIYQYLPEDGVAIMPYGSEFSEIWKKQSGTNNVVTFGTQSSADIVVTSQNDKIELQTPKGVIVLSLALHGEHNHLNAAAATAIALQFDIELIQIKQGLEGISAVTGRLQTRVHSTGARIIDDTYNANPNSAKAAMKYLFSIEGKRIFVLGDMGELGDLSYAAHQQIGKLATDLGIDEFYSFGKKSQVASDAFLGISKHFSNMPDLVKHLTKSLDVKVTILVKGSRFMKMERLVQALLEGKK